MQSAVCYACMYYKTKLKMTVGEISDKFRNIVTVIHFLNLNGCVINDCRIFMLIVILHSKPMTSYGMKHIVN